MHSKPTNTKKPVPEAGWELHTPYGTLKDIRGNPLERLEAVHALLMVRKGLTAAQAAAHVFGPFIANGNSELGMKHGADKLLPYLQIVDLAGCSFSVSDFAGVGYMAKLAELMPYVPHHHFDEGTPQALIYALGLMAGEAWAPHGVDVDLNDRLEDYGAEGYFPTMAKAREILGPFAVRHELAHKLWGWGTVAEVVPLHAVSPTTVDASDKPPPLTAQAADAGPGNVSGLSDKKNVRVRVTGTSWTDEQESLLQLDFKAANGESDAAKHKAVAALWGIKPDSVKKQLSAIKERVKGSGPMGSIVSNLSDKR